MGGRTKKETVAVVACEGVRRRFGERLALDGVTLEVRRGEVFGLIGPNGAGKTTLLNCVLGLVRPDEGRVRVLGADPIAQRRALALRIGAQLQSAALPPRITVAEAMRLFSAFYPETQPWPALLERLGIEGLRDRRVDRLSGGERQRVFIALALLHEPELVLLDELTTALDPKARASMWRLVAEIRERGATVLLTTHDMAEAEALCDRVAVIDEGRLVALGGVAELVAEYAPNGAEAPDAHPSARRGLAAVFLNLTGRAVVEGETA